MFSLVCRFSSRLDFEAQTCQLVSGAGSSTPSLTSRSRAEYPRRFRHHHPQDQERAINLSILTMAGPGKFPRAESKGAARREERRRLPLGPQPRAGGRRRRPSDLRRRGGVLLGGAGTLPYVCSTRCICAVAA